MVGSKQQAHFWYSPVVSVITPTSDLLRKGLKELTYLYCPEDTTGNIGCLRTEMTCSKAIRALHVIKGLFWVIVSISVSVAVGQLL